MIKPKLIDWCSSNGVKVRNTVSKTDLFHGKEKIVIESTLFKEEQTIPKKQLNCLAIKKNITKGAFPTEVCEADFIKNNFDGIEFKGELAQINALKKYLKDNTNLIVFYISSISGRQGIRSPYVFEINDLLEFPYIDHLDDYITKSEKIIIDDIIKYTLEEFGQGENALINNSIADKQNLIDFSLVYCENLNKYYSFDNKQYKLTCIEQGDAFYVCEIKHTDKAISQIPFETRTESLNELLLDWNLSKSAKTNKIIRYYDNTDNIIRIIKPKQLRFWLKSKALRDADDTFNDILTF